MHRLDALEQRLAKKDFQGLAESMDAKSLINTYNLEDNALSFLINIPQGLFNALFRPFIWESYSPFILISQVYVSLYVSCVICGICSISGTGQKVSLPKVHRATGRAPAGEAASPL